MEDDEWESFGSSSAFQQREEGEEHNPLDFQTSVNGKRTANEMDTERFNPFPFTSPFSPSSTSDLADFVGQSGKESNKS